MSTERTRSQEFAPIPSTDEPIRLLVITMGGERKARIERAFTLDKGFEVTFFEGVSSRQLRSRAGMLKTLLRCGIIDSIPTDDELASGFRSSTSDPPALRKLAFATIDEMLRLVVGFCILFAGAIATRLLPLAWLETVGLSKLMATEGKHSRVHPGLRIWRMCKNLGRDRAVLACTLAHLAAMRYASDHGFDAIMEDNVVASPYAADIMRAAARASPRAHLRYYAYGGRPIEMEAFLDKVMKEPMIQGKEHVRAQAVGWPQTILAGHTREQASTRPTSHPSKNDSVEMQVQLPAVDRGENVLIKWHSDPMPAGSNRIANLLWGTMCYAVSPGAVDAIESAVRSDLPGALAWSPRRSPYAIAKPVDKIIPRHVIKAGLVVQVAVPPALFRSPTTSLIHKHMDNSFAETTRVQLHWSGARIVASSGEDPHVVGHAGRGDEWVKVEGGAAPLPAAAIDATNSALGRKISKEEPATPVPVHSPKPKKAGGLVKKLSKTISPRRRKKNYKSRHSDETIDSLSDGAVVLTHDA